MLPAKRRSLPRRHSERRRAPRAAPFRLRLIVMAKAPVAGRVKTRIAAELGVATAVRFARHSLLDVGVVLVGGNREQAEEQAIDDAEILEEISQNFVQASLILNPTRHEGAAQDRAEPA